LNRALSEARPQRTRLLFADPDGFEIRGKSSNARLPSNRRFSDRGRRLVERENKNRRRPKPAPVEIRAAARDYFKAAS